MKRFLLIISIVCLNINLFSVEEQNFGKMIIGKWQLVGHECNISGVCSIDAKTRKILYNFGEFEIGKFKRRQLLMIEKNNTHEGYYNISNRTIRTFKSKDTMGRENWAGEPIVILSIKDNTMIWYLLTKDTFQVLKKLD